MRVTKFAYLTLAGAALCAAAFGAREADIVNTKHNLSASSSNTVRSDDGTDEICVFCHTPHGANTDIGGPLWNRSQDPGQTYIEYTSSSLQGGDSSPGVLDAPGGSSKLCLSCHDGTVAIGSVNNKPGSGGYDSAWDRPDPISMTGTSGGAMPEGAGSGTGFTRLLGTDLSNDHPISVTLDAGLAGDDGELWTPSAKPEQEITFDGETIVGNRAAGGLTTDALLPLEDTGTGGNAQVQCGTCHDPHIVDPDTNVSLGVSIKFLRQNRFQLANPVDNDFNKSDDIVCLACHNKVGWANSVHAVGASAGEPADDEYKNDVETTNRDFPAGLAVYQAACLNCHDTHTEAGAERLLREGADGTPLPAIEETCFQCHTNAANSLVEAAGGGNTEAPDIESEFLKTVRMPITTSDQRTTGSPAHDITDADFSEDVDDLGSDDVGGPGNVDNRHVECSDCHNPHRVIRNSRFNEDGVDDGQDSTTLRTHIAGLDQTTGGENDGREGNVASGALAGAWGVEPSWGAMNTTWPQEAATFDVVSGEPGVSVSESSTYLTREYQLCFKCHSSYSLNSTDMPDLGGHGGGTTGTAQQVNNMTDYTNVAAEFGSVDAANPPVSGNDQGEESNSGSACGGGDCNPSPSAPGETNNHRSWHPVMYPTGRDEDERFINATDKNFKAPFDDNIGTQTMHCSDCHGGETSYTEGVGPDLTKVQGPHGSNTRFLLKSNASNAWIKTSTTGGTSLNNEPNNYGFCGNCHQPQVNASGNRGSGFGYDGGDHNPDEGNMGNEACMNCHIAVPHGWKNKAFLVNLLCVGSEAPTFGGGECTSAGGYDKDTYAQRTYGPYYNQSRLRVPNWARSGNWGSSSCGGENMEDGCPKTN